MLTNGDIEKRKRVEDSIKARKRKRGRSTSPKGASDQAEHASGPYGKNLQSSSSAGASGQRDMSKKRCHYYKKPGHMIRDV
uniref:Uncharacterized protein n=1 Tax=Utricularia reniformis TaxID=192314 RepID=A0A1Y0B2Q1_9LAMI|nr:hypothetical protein AEK19_MT1478 [Utricularia reniformis]ART31668.1 hypothetical protein AEK19_MT1478 [Utricularia reniformis]